MIQKINLSDKFSLFNEHWSPKIVAELNGQHVKVAKIQGEFEWHQHAHEDELFWIISGELEMHLRDQVITLGPGEVVVIPRGVEHKPVAKEEVQIVLFEPIGTRNTGEQVNERTVDVLEEI